MPQSSNPFDETTLLTQLGIHLATARQDNHRLVLVLSGEQEWQSKIIQVLWAALPKELRASRERLYSDADIWPVAPRPWSTVADDIGQTLASVIVDLNDDIPVNHLGLISGTVHGGGVLVLLCPPACDWQSASRFLMRAKNILQAGQALYWDQGCGLRRCCQPTPDPTINRPVQAEGQGVLSPFATSDQQTAVQAIRRVRSGHRRRPLVLTADRGRGKSAALGIAAAQLMEQEPGMRIVATGPSRKATDTLFDHAARLLPGASIGKGRITARRSELIFIPPDELSRGITAVNLVLVDEAAALPVPLLTRLLQYYARIVFASTIHGYEGTGRGFAIRFHKTLNSITPKWRHCQLERPIRWAVDDPAEQLINRLLLLDVEPGLPGRFLDGQTLLPDNTNYRIISQRDLVEQEPLLGQIAGLLVNAHYQTCPDDLKQLMDRDDLLICALSTADSGTIVACALVSLEGRFDGSTADAIWLSQRRPRGHLLPQTLAAHAGHRDAARLSMARVMRLAVHADVQQRGFGTRLVDAIRLSVQERGVDILGSCFGATVELVRFWQRCQLQPVHIGSTRNAASGCYSMAVICPLTAVGETLYQQAIARFVKTFPYLASHTFTQMDGRLLMTLTPACYHLTDGDKAYLRKLADGHMPIDACLPELHALTLAWLPQATEYLSEQYTVLLTSKFMQNKSWKEAIHESGISGRKEAEQAVRKAAETLLKLARQNL